MPVNEGYPPMPPLNVSAVEAETIADYLIKFKVNSRLNPFGKISGRVINSSAGKNVEGINVILRSFIGDKETGSSLNITKSDGLFEFSNLNWSNSYSLFIDYQGVQYETDKMVFSPEEDSKELNLPIYETTTEDKDIYINLNHVVINRDDDLLSVAEIYEFENRSNKIFIGNKDKDDRRITLEFSVPAFAENVNFVQGVQESVRENDRLYDLSGFQPGKKNVVFTYLLPEKQSKLLLDRTIKYPISKLLFLTNESDDNIKVVGLNPMEEVKVDGETYLRWFSENLLVGDKVKITIKSKQISSNIVKYSPFIIFISFLLVSLILIILGRGSRSQNKSESNIKEIVDEIANIDNLFEDNRIVKEDYIRQRNKLKGRLIKLSSTKNLQNKTGE